MFFTRKFKRDKVTDVVSGGVGGGNIPPVVPPVEPPATPVVQDITPVPGEKKFDDDGYEIIEEPGAEETDEVVPPKENPKPPEEEIEGENITGYDPEKPPEKPSEEVKPPIKDEPPVVDGKEIKLDLVGLDEDAQAKVNEFVKKHGVNEKVGQAYADDLKADKAQAAANAAQDAQDAKNRLVETRREWFEELKTDKDFGGEKFAFNVKQVHKVVEDFMPNLKKQLTAMDAMMPPYVMKDLAKLAGHLYGAKTLATGDPLPPAPEVKEDDPLAFYE